MILEFFEIVQLADILAVKPNDDTLQRVIFDPESVRDHGWLIYVNFLLHSLCLGDPSQAQLASSLKHNTRLALDDAKLFLEPSGVNIQALMMLACHGEDYSSPNLSWMLMGHACQQAQAIGLHVPKEGDFGERQRQLALFWSLFAVDKSCSLAFGRPVFLPTTTYKDTPLPDFEYLKGYQPHRGGAPPSASSSFGAYFFHQKIELAKLTGNVLDSLGNAPLANKTMILLNELKEWDVETSKVCGYNYSQEFC